MSENSFGSYLRKDIMYYAILIILGIFSFKLFKMQILDMPVYEEQSEENSVKAIPIQAPRGVIYDKDFSYLVSNKPTYTLQIVPSEFDSSMIKVLEDKLPITPGFINKIIKRNIGYPSHIPRKIFDNTDISTIAWVEENRSFLKGIQYTIELTRDYSFGVYGSHMFGYIREIDSGQLQKLRDRYDLGDYIGYNGIEKTYEDLLHGRKGAEYFIVDSKQRKKGRYENGSRDFNAEKGLDLVLTIDRDVQIVAEELFKEKSGAIVAIEPSTGEILAFVSSPYYDLSQLSSANSNEIWRKLTNDESKPLFNRATMSRNPPGSTFKMILAMAALDAGVVTTSETVNCRGAYQYGNRPFKCTHVHGTVNLQSAIEHSCNTYFYQLILKVGLDKWAETGKMFGFGKKTGIDIGEESVGIMPDADYFDKTYGKGKWTKGYLLSLAIGQGDLITTPIQLAQYVAMLAGDGHSVQPHFLKGYIDKSNNFVALDYPRLDAEVSARTMDIVKAGMYDVVNGTGTATNIKSTELKIAGKTGTAQNPHGKDHALFVAFAPFDDPKIAVSVIVENVGFGSTHAAPIAKEVIKTYLNKLNNKTNSQVAGLYPGN